MQQERSLVKTIVTCVAGLAAVAACAIALSARDSTVREIRIVAREMTFYLEGGTEPNPVLRVGRVREEGDAPSPVRLRGDPPVRLVLRDVGQGHLVVA